ncbi:MAG: nucleoside 2-deoxyribosyltransferase domain-containing protein [Bacillota bacterium]|nr:nucleoside 2-deoxyribosyltransferase domain-containing protein [Bacillota bacterium]
MACGAWEDIEVKKVFLGGTCNESTWRNDLISMLKIDYFNPVAEDWTPECMAEERKQRETCDFCLYTITPKMTGVYSIAEVADDSNKRPEKTLFCVLDEDDGLFFTEWQRRSVGQVSEMVKRNGGKTFVSLYSVAEHLNKSR